MDKQAEKEEKSVIKERMRREEDELEKMLNEITQNQSLSFAHHQHQHHNLVSGSPFSRVSLQSTTEYSSPSSSCFSNCGFCCFSEDDASPFSKPNNVLYNNNVENANKYKTHGGAATDCFNDMLLDAKSTDSCFHREIVNESLDYEMGLCENLYRMNVGGVGEEHLDHSAKLKRLERLKIMDPLGVGFGFTSDASLEGSVGVPYNAEKCSAFDCFNNAVSDYQGLSSSRTAVSKSFDDERKSVLVAFGGQYGEGDLKESNFGLGLDHSNDLRFGPSYTSLRHQFLEQRMEQGRSWTNAGTRLQNPSRISRSYVNDAFVGAQQLGFHSNPDIGVMNHLFSNQLVQTESDLHLDALLYNRSMLKERTNSMTNNRVSESFMPVNGAGAIEGFGCEDSFIIQGRSVNHHVANKGRDSLRSHKQNNLNEIATRNSPVKICKHDGCAYDGGICDNDQSLMDFHYPLHLLSRSTSLADVRGYIYSMAKDQNGCRFLQRVFDEGNFLDLQIIFEEVIDHIVELMMEQFGNYLVQKLLNVCTEEQRIQILLMVTEEPGQLVRVCLNTYGTRVVQKLIETLKTRQQISLVKAALKPGFLDLIKDLNGNHVLQRCLQCLSNEDNEFIFDAAAKFCVDIATHQHGCCVLQRCIAHSIGRHRDKLITEISKNGLHLAQDPFGNYVVQYIIELKIPSVNANLLSQFKGHYVHLSTQKFSSHVVEKCLKHFGESRSQIVHELLSVPHFEQLLQDPFANYVIQCALSVTKGPLHASLVESARPHTNLRTSPYCKRIFSRNISKK